MHLSNLSKFSPVKRLHHTEPYGRKFDGVCRKNFCPTKKCPGVKIFYPMG